MLTTDLSWSQGLVDQQTDDFSRLWDTLNIAFREIHARNESKLSFEELFRSAYQLVIRKHGDWLWDKIQDLESEVLDDRVNSQIKSLASTAILLPSPTESPSVERKVTGEKFLHSVTKSFDDYKVETKMIADVLMYMDRINASYPKYRKPSVFAMTQELFRQRILNARINEDLDLTVQDLLESIILDVITMERHGEMVDRLLVKGACQMLRELYWRNNKDEECTLYNTSFVPKFLVASRTFYHDEGQALVQAADATFFCAQAQRRLLQEEKRCYHVLAQETRPLIVRVVEEELVSAHIAAVIGLPGTGVNSMIDNDKIDDLQNVYQLVKRVDPRLKALKDAIHQKVLSSGRDINNSAAAIATEPTPKVTKPEKKDGAKGPVAKPLNQQTVAAISWVEEVLKLRAKYTKLWEQALQSNSVMEKSLEISFQDFINENRRSPEFLSLFLDQYLKSTGKDKSEAEVDALLDNGVKLVQYLADKDILESYYHKHMAKRLITRKSISRDVERLMLSKMKMRLGNQFTTKMEHLLKDVELSEELTSSYKQSMQALGQGSQSKIDLEVSILTTTVWPVGVPDASERSCNYPRDMQQIKDSFENAYLSKHTGRKLTWLPHMGDVTLRATYRKAGKPITYEVNGSIYAAIVLSLFNEHERLTADEIQQITNIPSEKLTHALLSIAVAPKTRLLKKEPAGAKISPEDVFTINDKFEHAFRKFKLAVVTEASNRVETNEQRKETQRKADEERGLAVDAAIVRIMKARKTLSHQNLMTETIQILSSRFQPDVAMIKRKIESLIERDYLERGPDDVAPSYNYLA